MRIWVSALCSAALVALTGPAPAASLQDAWNACTARQQLSADRIAHCTTVIESRDVKAATRAQALVARGFAHTAQRNFDRALADFDAAIQENPNLATAHYYRGAILAQTDPEGALAALDKAISLNPKDPDFFRERSSVHVKRKDYARAIDDLTSAIGLARNPKGEYFLRGSAYEELGERDKAIADYQASLLLEPDNDMLRRHLVQLGAEIPKAIQLPPGPCSANDITHEQRVAGCTAAIDSGTLTGWPLKIAYCNRGYALTELGEFDRVIADSNLLIGINPQAGCSYLNRGRAWYYKHDLDRAIADYTEAIAFEPRLHEAYASRGTAYFDRRDFPQAIADYDAAISLNPFVPMYFSDRGNTRYQMGDLNRAIADYNRAIEVDPDYVQAYVRRGWAFLKADDLARSEADFDKALQLAPGDTYAVSGRAQVYQRQNRPVPEGQATGLSFEKFRRALGQPDGRTSTQKGPP
ncbi:MAG: tetratricopeptide repeat protein [Alphaproteobacteria bacterium]